MTIHIQNVVIACPGNTEESYARGGRRLATFYADLLGMRIVQEDWFVIAYDDDPGGLRLAFGDGPIDYQPPRWPDPDFPQQLHLDITVDDLETSEHRALQLGASKLQDKGTFGSYADPDGHPFCLYSGATDEPAERTQLGRIDRVVIDCYSPRTLANFYATLLNMPRRELDTPDRVVIARADGRVPALAFQHAQFPAPRWPDPAYPQQVHLDLRVTNPDTPDSGQRPVDESHLRAARDLAESLGAIHLSSRDDPLHILSDPAGHPFCLY